MKVYSKATNSQLVSALFFLLQLSFQSSLQSGPDYSHILSSWALVKPSNFATSPNLMSSSTVVLSSSWKKVFNNIAPRQTYCSQFDVDHYCLNSEYGFQPLWTHPTIISCSTLCNVATYSKLVKMIARTFWFEKDLPISKSKCLTLFRIGSILKTFFFLLKVHCYLVCYIPKPNFILECERETSGQDCELDISNLFCVH